MELQPVISSNIKAAGFADGKMQIQFNSGTTYEAETTQADYNTFMAVKSKGSHFAKVMKTAFIWKKIEKKG